MGQSGVVMRLTGVGAGGIAVVRVAGAGVRGFLEGCFSKAARAGRCVHGELRDGDEVVDDPVVVLHEDGRTADISVHGGPWVVSRVLGLAARHGFSVAEATAGAVEGERTIEQEVMAYLPAARTEAALRVLLGQAEAWERLEQRIGSGQVGRAELEQIGADSSLVNLLRLPRVAIVGPANVGKSTLANRLFAQERSITADVPGTTRDWVGEVADVDGLAVMLIDTPGLRLTEDGIERQAIEHSRGEIDRADLVVVVFDDRSPEPAVRQMLDRHPGAVLVRNKADRAGVEVGGTKPIRAVGITGDGVDALRRAIAEHFGCADLDASRVRPFTARQAAVLRGWIDRVGLVSGV